MSFGRRLHSPPAPGPIAVTSGVTERRFFPAGKRRLNCCADKTVIVQTARGAREATSVSCADDSRPFTSTFDASVAGPAHGSDCQRFCPAVASLLSSAVDGFGFPNVGAGSGVARIKP